MLYFKIKYFKIKYFKIKYFKIKFMINQIKYIYIINKLCVL